MDSLHTVNTYWRVDVCPHVSTPKHLVDCDKSW